MKPTTTRRGLMKAAPLAAIAATIPAAANAFAADRSAWTKAMCAYRSAVAEDDAFTPNWWETWKKCKAECEAIPHITLRPDPHTGRHSRITTADTRFVSRVRKTVADVDAGKMYFEDTPDLQEHLQLCRDVANAADERDRRVQAIRNGYDMDALDDKAEQLGDRIAECRERLMKMPAPDLAALHWTLEQFREDDGDVAAWTASYVEQTFADIERLMPEAA